MKFGLEPIRNDSPYKRIGQDPKPAEPEQVGIKSTWQICQEITERHEQERVWALIRQTAEGTNTPTSSPSSTGSPIDSATTVCADGWEAA